MMTLFYSFDHNPSGFCFLWLGLLVVVVKYAIVQMAYFTNNLIHYSLCRRYKSLSVQDIQKMESNVDRESIR